MKITVIRHGETDVNADGLIKGQITDFPLNDNGREQARHATEKLPGDIAIIVSSPLLRATQTARVLGFRCFCGGMLSETKKRGSGSGTDPSVL